MASIKVLLVNSNLRKPSISPIGLDYVGSFLATNGFNVDLLDLHFSDSIKSDIKNKLVNSSFLAIGVNIRNIDDFSYINQEFYLPKIKEIVEEIRKYCHAPIILGGGGFSIMPLEIAKYIGADYGIIGDGEVTFLELLENIKSHKEDLSENIDGIVFKDSIYKKTEPVFSSLENFPLPDRDLSDNKRYFKEGARGSIETKRGCNRNCIYCTDPITKGPQFRVRPIKTVIKELKNLIEKDINIIRFCDSEFNIPMDYATDLLNQIIDSGIGSKIQWYSNMCSVSFNDSFTKLLKKAGCAGIEFGADSACEKMLKSLRKNYTLDDLSNVVKLCSKYEIEFYFGLLFGGPGEDEKTIKDTIDYMKKLAPTEVYISFGLRVYPGTYLSRIINNEILLSTNTLHGNILDNAGFLKPIFYISEKVGKDIVEYTKSLVASDKRFMID